MTLRKAWPSKAVQADADDMRYNLRGNVVRDVNGVPRAGLLGYRAAPLVTALPSMSVRVAAFDAVATRDGGVVFLSNDGSVDIALTAAPAANSRIDVVYAKQNDSTATVSTPDPTGDPLTNKPVLLVVKGEASPIPVKPSTIPQGGVELATVLFPAGATATNSGGVVITQSHRFTAMSGGIVPVRNAAERDNGFAWADATKILRIDLGASQTRLGGAWSEDVRINGGRYTGNTSSTGTVTVNHGLPSTPKWVHPSNANGGVIPSRRRFTTVTANATQIQFVCYRDDGQAGEALVLNPVDMFWSAGI